MPATKRCFKCGETKSTAGFYRHPQTGDGLLGKCKDCTKRDVNSNYRKTWTDKVAYERRRWQRPERRRASTASLKRQKARNPTKAKARNAVTNAIRDGRLVKQPCAKCRATKGIQAHHHDYSKALEVEWLCRPCHLNEHGKWSFERFAATGRPLLIAD